MRQSLGEGQKGPEFYNISEYDIPIYTIKWNLPVPIITPDSTPEQSCSTSIMFHHAFASELDAL